MAQEASGKAIGSLVCGILGIVSCGILTGIPAIILASGEDHGFAKAGKIMGWISVVLTIGFILLFALGILGAGIAGAN